VDPPTRPATPGVGCLALAAGARVQCRGGRNPCRGVRERALVHNMSHPNPGPANPTPGSISQAEVNVVRAAWARNRNDIGLGLYNPSTGEIHVGTFDTTGHSIGHDGLQSTLQISDAERPRWRGFVFSSGGQAINQSGFNTPDGAPPRIRADYFAQVEDALRRARLI
jgi:hypothetical protein